MLSPGRAVALDGPACMKELPSTGKVCNMPTSQVLGLNDNRLLRQTDWRWRPKWNCQGQSLWPTTNFSHCVVLVVALCYLGQRKNLFIDWLTDWLKLNPDYNATNRTLILALLTLLWSLTLTEQCGGNISGDSIGPSIPTIPVSGNMLATSHVHEPSPSFLNHESVSTDSFWTRPSHFQSFGGDVVNAVNAHHAKTRIAPKHILSKAKDFKLWLLVDFVKNYLWETNCPSNGRGQVTWLIVIWYFNLISATSNLYTCRPYKFLGWWRTLSGRG